MEKAGFFLKSQKILCQEVLSKTARPPVVRGCEIPGKVSLAAAMTPPENKSFTEGAFLSFFLKLPFILLDITQAT